MKSVLFISFVLCEMLGIVFTTADVAGQGKMSNLKRSEIALVLKALDNEWALVDDSPDIDFLIFVNESRDELNFYPQKSLVSEIEKNGFIINADKDSSLIRRPHTHYKGDYSRGEVQAITEAGSIVYSYQVTEKGRKYLQDTPKITGKRVAALKIAKFSKDVRRKVLNVVIYDRQALGKINDEFIQKATAQVKDAFSSKSDFLSKDFTDQSLIIGARLWRKVESAAALNGLQPGILVQQRTSIVKGKVTEETSQLDVRPLGADREVRLFWRILRDILPFNDPVKVRKVTLSEASLFPYFEEIIKKRGPFQQLVVDSQAFIVESGEAGFIVIVEKKREQDFLQGDPEIKGVEIVDRDKK